MRKKQLIALVFGVLLVAAAALLFFALRGQRQAEGGEAVLSNPAFAAGGASGAPSGWQVKSYENEYRVTTEGGIVTLQTEVADDLRVMQEVSVRPSTKYVLTCEVKTADVRDGRGAGLSVDNMDIDRSCVYSDGRLGTSDWTRVELAFITMDKQTRAFLGMRLGGYGEASSGQASFRNISIQQTSSANVPFQQLVSWGEPNNNGDGEGGSERDIYFYKEVFTIILWAALLAAILMLVGFYANLKRVSAFSLTKKQTGWGIVIMLAVGVVLRYVLTWAFGGHETDMNCWIAWGNKVANDGPAALYAPNYFCDYPPGYMAVLGIIAKAQNLLGINAYGTFGRFAYMIPPMLADFGCALLAVRVGRKEKLSEGLILLVAGFIALNPAAIFLSGAWSQIDSILTLFLLFSIYYLTQNKRLLAGLFFGLAVIFKWQALMFGPLLAFAFLFSIKDMDDVLNTIVAVLTALTVIVLISLPFQGDQRWLWLVDKFMEAQDGYNYASVEAYNFLALIGGNWKATEGTLFEPFGWFAIVLSVLLSTAMLAAARRRNKDEKAGLFTDSGVLYLAAAFCMYMIFTFGHYMHERYVFPVIFLLLFAYVHYKDKRILLAAIFVTVTTFANVMTAMYIVSQPAMGFIRGSKEHNDLLRAVAFAQTLSFGYFAWICGDRFLGWGVRAKACCAGFYDKHVKKREASLKKWVKELLDSGE
ncbi:MAG: glycosyltransferase 87 family protein [Clostridiales bacterium]|nr:glycosyltransferase 87 family protein [Clostridiales bacterium]